MSTVRVPDGGSMNLCGYNCFPPVGRPRGPLPPQDPDLASGVAPLRLFLPSLFPAPGPAGRGRTSPGRPEAIPRRAGVPPRRSGGPRGARGPRHPAEALPRRSPDSRSRRGVLAVPPPDVGENSSGFRRGASDLCGRYAAVVSPLRVFS